MSARSARNWVPAAKVLAVGISAAVTVALVTVGMVHFVGTYYLTALKIGFVLSLFVSIKTYLILFRWGLVRKFLSGYTLAAIALCIAFAGLGSAALLQNRHFSKTKGVSITYDEVSILPAGYFYRQTGTYYINPEHPPLVKFVAALPIALLEPKMPKETLPTKTLLQDYAQYYWGKVFLFETGNKTENIIFVARLAVLITNTILFFLLYLSIAYLWNKRAAFFALLFIVLSPFTLAHAMLVTVDVMAAVLTVLALVWFGIFLKSLAGSRRSWPSLVIGSSFLAGALVAKFSTILLVPVMLLGAVGHAFFEPIVRKKISGYIVKNLMFFTLALLLIVAFYSWHVRAMSSDQIIEQLKYNFAQDQLPDWLHSLVEQIARLGAPGRGIAEYLLGLIKVNTRIAKGAGGVYLLGKYYGSEGAGPLYFPILYLTKLTVPFLLASAVVFITALRQFWSKGLRLVSRSARDNVALWLLLIYGLLFLLIAITSTLQIGLRHIFPTIFCFAAATAYGMEQFFTVKKRKKQKHAAGRYFKLALAGGFIWLIINMTLTFPRYLSFYNVLGGGVKNGYKIAVDSNYDWGQDVKELAVWQQKNNVHDIYIDLFVNPFLPASYYLGDGVHSYKISDGKPLKPGSYLAVSATQYEISTGQHRKGKDYSELKRYQVARVGSSIFVFKIPG